MAEGEAGSGITVLVVDDHPLWRQTIRSVLERGGTATTVHEAKDGEEAAQMARQARPDVVLMDMELPHMNGVDATRTILQENADARVLVLSSSDDRARVVAAVRAGAAGYLLKTASSGEIQDGVRRVHAGELVFPPELAALVLAELRGGSTGPLAGGNPIDQLSARERSVLALMAEGRANDAIGEQLHLSPKTVEAHVTTIFGKLGLAEVVGGHKRVLAVIAYLNASAQRRENPNQG